MPSRYLSKSLLSRKTPNIIFALLEGRAGHPRTWSKFSLMYRQPLEPSISGTIRCRRPSRETAIVFIYIIQPASHSLPDMMPTTPDPPPLPPPSPPPMISIAGPPQGQSLCFKLLLLKWSLIILPTRNMALLTFKKLDIRITGTIPSQSYNGRYKGYPGFIVMITRPLSVT